GEGRQAAGHDPVSTHPVHLPARLRDRARTRRVADRQVVPLSEFDDGRDALAPFRAAIIGVRWGTVGVGLVLAAADIHDNNATTAVWCAVVAAYAALRTLRPLRVTDNPRTLVAVLLEVALHVGVVAATGYWDSPFIFSLITAIIIAGFSRGFAFSLLVAALSVLGVSVPDIIYNESPQLRVAAQWASEMVLIALVAGYARRISG